MLLDSTQQQQHERRQMCESKFKNKLTWEKTLNCICNYNDPKVHSAIQNEEPKFSNKKIIMDA